MKNLMLLLGTVTLCACGPQSLVTDGTYQSVDNGAGVTNASLTVSLSAKTATVALTGATDPVVLQMASLPSSQWELGCPTNVSSVAVETWTLSPDPTVIGTLSLTQPRLIAGCGLDAANPNEVVIAGTGAPNDTQYRLVFQRQ